MPGNKPKKRHSVTQPLDESYRLIPLTQGQNAIVDAADFEWLSQWNWFAALVKSTGSFYAKRGKNIFLHQVLLGIKGVDHKNNNTLDNRRENLRPCSQAQNSANAKKSRRGNIYKGASFHKRQRMWNSHIRIGRKLHHLGSFKTAEEAARAYDAAAKEKFGEFAHLNFPLTRDSKPIARRNSRQDS